MKSKPTNLLLDISVWFLLVAAAVWARMFFDALPNFAPFAAVALFAGFYFNHRLMAIAAPLAAKGIWDFGFEPSAAEPLIMLSVYSCLAAPVALRPLLRKVFETNGSAMDRFTRRSASVAGGAVLASCLFFIVTNLAVWQMWYEPTVSDLWMVYLQAVPFFRYTLLSNLMFAGLFFGSYEIATSLVFKYSTKKLASY